MQKFTKATATKYLRTEEKVSLDALLEACAITDAEELCKNPHLSTDTRENLLLEIYTLEESEDLKQSLVRGELFRALISMSPPRRESRIFDEAKKATHVLEAAGSRRLFTTNMRFFPFTEDELIEITRVQGGQHLRHISIAGTLRNPAAGEKYWDFILKAGSLEHLKEMSLYNPTLHYPPFREMLLAFCRGMPEFAVKLLGSANEDEVQGILAALEQASIRVWEEIIPHIDESVLSKLSRPLQRELLASNKRDVRVKVISALGQSREGSSRKQ